MTEFDKTAFSNVPLSAADDTLACWLSRTVEERWEAIELMRQALYGYDPATARLQRVFEVVEREGS